MSTQLFMNDKQLNLKALKKYVQDDAQAQKEYNKGMTSTVFAFIFGSVGGTIVCTDFARAVVTSRDIQPGTIIAGLAVAAISIPFAINSSKHYRRAATLYNKSRHKTGRIYGGNELRFVGIANSFGIRYSFR